MRSCLERPAESGPLLLASFGAFASLADWNVGLIQRLIGAAQVLQLTLALAA
jgi:hypothetical protein